LQEFAGLQQSLAQLVVPLGFPLENADLTPKNEDFLGDFLGFLRGYLTKKNRYVSETGGFSPSIGKFVKMCQ
jgi:hypothetical protein